MKEGKMESRPSDEVPEEIKSEEIDKRSESLSAAKEKLKLILDPRLKDFAVRFVNIGEYEAIMNSSPSFLPSGDINTFRSHDIHSIFTKIYPQEIVSTNQQLDQLQSSNGQELDASAISFIKGAAKLGWEKVIIRMTDWERSSLGIRAEQLFINYLKDAHHEALKSGQKNIRARTIDILRHKLVEAPEEQKIMIERSDYGSTEMNAFQIIDYANDEFTQDQAELKEIKQRLNKLVGDNHANYIYTHTEPSSFGWEWHSFKDWNHIGASYDDYPSDQEYKLYGFKEATRRHQLAKEEGEIPDIKALLDNERKEVEELQNKLATLKFKLTFFGEKNVEKIHNFLNADTPIDLDEMREIAHIIREAAHFAKDLKYMLYHVALIYDLRRSQRFEKYAGWSGFAQEYPRYSETEAADYLLGAVSLVSDKENWRKMQEKVSNSGRMAHPIFDNKGNLKWPLEKEDK